MTRAALHRVQRIQAAEARRRRLIEAGPTDESAPDAGRDACAQDRAAPGTSIPTTTTSAERGAAAGQDPPAAAPAGMAPDEAGCGCGRVTVKRTGEVEQDGIVHRYGRPCCAAEGSA